MAKEFKNVKTLLEPYRSFFLIIQYKNTWNFVLSMDKNMCGCICVVCTDVYTQR